MPKITLNPAPTFKGVVSIPVPGEKPAEVEFVFKHRTRKQFDELMKKTKADVEAGTDGAGDTAFVMSLVEGWNVDGEPFNAENVEKLLENYHAAGRAISERYTELLVLGRLGN